MTVPPDIAVHVKGWVKKVEHDIRNAASVLSMGEDCPTDTVCFHCQPCAEQYLKALFVLHGIEFPRTHALVVLSHLLRAPTGLAVRVEDVQPLNRYAVEARHPGEWDPIEMPEATRAPEAARASRRAVRELLPEGVLQSQDSSMWRTCRTVPIPQET